MNKRYLAGMVGLAVFVLGGYSVSGRDRFVSPSGSETGGYTNWAMASKTIQQAINACSNGDTVWVTNGIFNISSQISVTKGITVSSLNGATATVIDGGGITRCVSISASNSIVNGFTIRNGYLNTYPLDGAGVLILTNGLVCNSIICNNGNYNRDGGGASLEYGGTLRNCLIVSNTCNNSGWGGGVNMYNGGLVEDCTIVFNANGSGAGISINQGGTVNNCIVYSNSGGSDLVNHSGGTVTYSCVPQNGSFSGVGNITNNPLFAMGFHLATNSPCINKGTNQSWMATATDLDGLSRISSVVVDMGAYETHFDSDGDGIPDAWTLQYFGHITGQVGDKSLASDDADGDGYTNLEEYQNGGNPKVFDIGSAYVWTAIEVGWKSVSGTNYQVQCVTDLAATNWVNLGSNIVGNGAVQSVLDSCRTNTHKFYRVTVP